MTYSIDFYNVGVRAEVEGWPAGINASFTRIAEQMVESGPNLGLPYTRPFGDGLFEMRAKGAGVLDGRSSVPWLAGGS